MHDRREQAIYDAAIEVFADKGFDRTTMDEIATHANVSKGTLFYRYNSKEELFIQIVQHALERFFATGQPALTSVCSASGRIAFLLAMQVELAYANPNMAKLLFRELWGIVSRHPSLREQLNVYIRYLRGVIEEGISSGELQPVDSEMLAVALLGMTAAAALRSVLAPGERKAVITAGELQKYVLTGIRGGDASCALNIEMSHCETAAT